MSSRKNHNLHVNNIISPLQICILVIGVGVLVLGGILILDCSNLSLVNYRIANRGTAANVSKQTIPTSALSPIQSSFARTDDRTNDKYINLSQQGSPTNIQQHNLKDELRNQVNAYLITNTLPIPEGYEPFQVGNDNNIEIKGDWALFNLMSVPTKEKQDEYGTAPDILLGVAHKENGEWKVYIESTPNYLNILSSLPDWLQWLAKRN